MSLFPWITFFFSFHYQQNKQKWVCLSKNASNKFSLPSHTAHNMHIWGVHRSAPSINSHCDFNQPREYRGYLWLAMQGKWQVWTVKLNRSGTEEYWTSVTPYFKWKQYLSCYISERPYIIIAAKLIWRRQRRECHCF